MRARESRTLEKLEVRESSIGSRDDPKEESIRKCLSRNEIDGDRIRTAGVHHRYGTALLYRDHLFVEAGDATMTIRG